MNAKAEYTVILEIEGSQYKESFETDIEERDIASYFIEHITGDTDIIEDIGLYDYLNDYVGNVLHGYIHEAEPVYYLEDIHKRMSTYAMNFLEDNKARISLRITSTKNEKFEIPSAVIIQYLSTIIENHLDPAYEIYGGYFIRAIVDSLETFTRDSKWQIGICTKAGDIYTDRSLLSKDEEVYPIIWFGLPNEKPSKPWCISSLSTKEDIAFWFFDLSDDDSEETTLKYLILDDPEYGQMIRWGIWPIIDFKMIRDTCPISIKELFDEPKGELSKNWQERLCVMLRSLATVEC